MNRPNTSIKRSSLLLIVFYIFLASTPIVWVRLFNTSIAPYHVVAIGVIFTVLLARGFMSNAEDVFRSARLIWFGALATILAMALSFTKAQVIYEPFYFLKYVVFVVTAFASAILMLAIVRRGAFSYLGLVPAFVSIVFLVFISFQFAAADIDPFATLALAIARSDPNIVIFQFFRASFNATNSGLEYRSTLKQNLSLSFVAIIPLGILALQFIPRGKKILRYIAIAGLLFCVIMAIAPFSRAAWLALALIGACYAMTFVRSARGLVVFAAGLIFGIPAVFLIGSGSEIFGLLEARFSSADSVEARIYATEEHWQAIGESPIFGRSNYDQIWSHNVLIDSWSAFGLAGLAGSLLFFLGTLLIFGKALIFVLTKPVGQRYVHATIAALMCPVIVRIFTVPNVTVDFPVWVGLGIAVGLAADAWAETASASAAPRGAALPGGALSAA